MRENRAGFSNDGPDGRYRCRGCHKFGQVRGLTVKNGQFCVRKDPESGHHPECKPISDVEVEILTAKREMLQDVRRHGKRPRDAYLDTQVSLPSRKSLRTDPAMHDAVAAAFPDYHSVKDSLKRRRSEIKAPVPDPSIIPAEYLLTLYGRVNQGNPIDNPNFPSRWLLHQSSDGRIISFSSDVDLKTFHESDYLIGDGTFAYAPRSGSQLYSIVAFKRGKSLPVVYSVLPNKEKPTYITMWTAIRQAVLRLFGSLGPKKTIITDFEPGVPDVIKSIFSPDEVEHKGCLFHFRQIMVRQFGKLGLLAAYKSKIRKDESPSQEKLDMVAARDWLRLVMALPMFPPEHIPKIWNLFLKTPPQIGDINLRRNLLKFSDYFTRRWISGRFYSIDMWSHFYNNGYRTSNHAEGHHRGLAFHIENQHPTLADFLHDLQRHHYQIQRQIHVLNDPSIPDFQRSPDQILLEDKISAAKLDLQVWLACSATLEDFEPAFIAYSTKYLKKMAGYIGVKHRAM